MYRIGQFVSRHKVAFLLSALVFLIVTAVMVVALSRPKPASKGDGQAKISTRQDGLITISYERDGQERVALIKGILSPAFAKGWILEIYQQKDDMIWKMRVGSGLPSEKPMLDAPERVESFPILSRGPNENQVSVTTEPDGQVNIQYLKVSRKEGVETVEGVWTPSSGAGGGTLRIFKECGNKRWMTAIVFEGSGGGPIMTRVIKVDEHGIPLPNQAEVIPNGPSAGKL